MKIITVIGARPNFVKLAPLIPAVKKYSSIKMKTVHTGQHYDYNMSKIFFESASGGFDLPKPDFYLKVGSDSHARQTGRVMMAFEKIVLAEKPDLIIVIGDVNSTLAAGLVAAKLHIPLAHIEAGVRSFDRTMPEEINRVVTDSLSDILFAPSNHAVANLLKEGIPRRKIFMVGNIMMDTLFSNLNRINKSTTVQQLKLIPRKYAVLTLHRPSNVDNKIIFMRIVKALNQIKKRINIIWPVHPRTHQQISRFKMERFFSSALSANPSSSGAITLIKPLSYTDCLGLFKQAAFVLTDSGGVQTETTALGVPCLTIRPNTEWIETISHGTNRLVGTNPQRIVKEAGRILARSARAGRIKLPKYWDGCTAQRIVKIIHHWSRR
ncbi:MAG: UDP-N-acetylglucosamine 2-epimerase (non-hydrolyzing) [Planctomycetota bacterium]